MLDPITDDPGSTAPPAGSAARWWTSASFGLSAIGLVVGIVSIAVVPWLSITPLALLFVATIPLAALAVLAGVVGLALGGGRPAVIAVCIGLLLAAAAPASLKAIVWLATT